MTKKKSFFKNIGLIILSTLFLVLSVLGLIVNIDIKNKAREIAFADSTTTNFYGSSFYVPVNIYYYDMDYTWTLKTWNGISNFSGQNVWTDGTNYYYSNSSQQYVLDVATSTWTTKVWNGFTSVSGYHIWTDGTNYYYSNGSYQYVLDVATSTWTLKTWNGLNNITGYCVWTDGTNYYYSNSSQQYVLDVATSTWSRVTWNGFDNIDGRYIWSDGINIYYSVYANIQYVLDVATSTWTTKVWNGLSVALVGNAVWTDGTNYYYSVASGTGNHNQYVLDVTSDTWLHITWGDISGLNVDAIVGSYIWYLNNFVYLSNSGYQYVLDTTKHFIQDYDNTYFTSIAFSFIDNVNSYNLYANSVIYSYDTNGQVKYSVSDMFVVSQHTFQQSDFYLDVAKIYDTTNYVDYINSNNSNSNNMPTKVLIPFEFFNKYNVKITACFYLFLSPSIDNFNLSFTSVQFGSYSDSLSNGTDEYISNYIYYNSSSWSIQIEFPCFAYSDTPVYYFADSSELITYYLGFTGQRPTNNYYFRFNERIYYFTNSVDGYDSGYNSGYHDGYNNGDTVGYNRGYTTGYNVGTTDGYNSGYNVGANAANRYTFIGLIGAVIDAPISAIFGYIDTNPNSPTYNTRINGLLNFNLLGINLSTFVGSLFTLAIIITIIKKVV